MTAIQQTVEIPASTASEGKRWLTIDIPREVPAGPVVLTFTPAMAESALPEDITGQLNRYYAGRSPESDSGVQQAAYRLFAQEDW
jgi:hypothetical protein